LTIKFTLDTEYCQRLEAADALLAAVYWLHGGILQLCSCPSIFNCQRSIFPENSGDNLQSHF
jgi:hypothetical protein